MHRRHLLQGGLGLLGLGACGLPVRAEEGFTSPRADAVTLPPAQWKEILTPMEFQVLREQGTERAFTGDLHAAHADGVFVCAGCGLPLYDSRTKFDSGTGWPSFWAAIGKDRVAELADHAFGMVRTELRCARCGGHLGHVFSDGPPPTGQRHCINSASLDLVPREVGQALEDAGLPVKLGGFDAPAPPAHPKEVP
ncbi:MAG: peptide-methionine (R)-S-oxide reductase MsrB [Alphaproteobacteria bacterium]|nr:peptide-methionine (R)-S-oxide reductase MsrB [Alphaproteobacteria bacterium]